MAVRVRLAGTLKAIAAGKAEIPASAGRVRAIIGELDRAYAGLGSRVLGADGALKKSVLVHLNGQDVRQLEGVETVVGESDELLITIPLAGG